MTHRTTIPQRIIAVLVAAWIPFCCCTLKVAGELLLQDGDSIVLGCCGHAKVTCDDDGSEPVEDTDDACVGCCIKILPDASGKWDPPVDHGEAPVDHGAVQILAPAASETGARPGLPRPPDPPPARTLLAQRCQFLV